MGFTLPWTSDVCCRRRRWRTLPPWGGWGEPSDKQTATEVLKTIREPVTTFPPKASKNTSQQEEMRRPSQEATTHPPKSSSFRKENIPRGIPPTIQLQSDSSENQPIFSGPNELCWHALADEVWLRLHGKAVRKTQLELSLLGPCLLEDIPLRAFFGLRAFEKHQQKTYDYNMWVYWNH